VRVAGVRRAVTASLAEVASRFGAEIQATKEGREVLDGG
jgi:hypothetical protein